MFFAAGPGDVVGTFRHWKQGRDDPSQMSVTWSGQFFDVCRDLGLIAYVAAWHARAAREADAQITVVSHPKPAWVARGGWRYHLGEQWYSLRMIALAVWFRADLVLVAGGLQLLPFKLLRLLRMQIVVDFECVLWRKYVPISRTSRLVFRLDRSLLRSQALALLSVSRDITTQLSVVADGRPRPILEYWPLYRKGRLERLPAPVGRPFRIVFAGRVERYKGVFDLVELARRFRGSRRDILIELCGEGGALEEVKRLVAKESLASHLSVHGYCMFDALRQIYARAHAVIVPTTSEFAEGFNMVVAEAVLVGRPVVTSDVCPAVSYLGDAVVQVPVDDIDAYEQAIERLARDPDLYERTRQAGATVCEKFFDSKNSFGAVLRAVLEAAQTGRLPAPRMLAISVPTHAVSPKLP